MSFECLPELFHRASSRPLTYVVAYSDIHVYYFQKNASQMKFARELWERIRRECKMALFIFVKAAQD